MGDGEGTVFELNQFEQGADGGTAADLELVLKVDLADEALSGGEALNVEHLRNVEDFLFDLGRVFNGVFHVFGHVDGGKALKVADFVVEGHGEC